MDFHLYWKSNLLVQFEVSCHYVPFFSAVDHETKDPLIQVI